MFLGLNRGALSPIPVVSIVLYTLAYLFQVVRHTAPVGALTIVATTFQTVSLVLTRRRASRNRTSYWWGVITTIYGFAEFLLKIAKVKIPNPAMELGESLRFPYISGIMLAITFGVWIRDMVRAIKGPGQDGEEDEEVDKMV